MRSFSIAQAVRVAICCWLLAFGSLLTANSQKLTATLTGDILLDRGVRKVVEKKGIDQLFSAGIDSVLQASDVVVGNLECPATKVKAPVYKQYIFRAEPEWLTALQQHGFTHLNLANNHSIDQGREGFLSEHPDGGHDTFWCWSEQTGGRSTCAAQQDTQTGMARRFVADGTGELCASARQALRQSAEH